MTENISEPNMLLEIHKCFMDSAISFREEVCAECNWSIPTFYRKMRAVDKPNKHFKDRIIPALSYAEKAGILRMASVLVDDLNKFLSGLKGNKN